MLNHISSSYAGRRLSYYNNQELKFYSLKSTFPWYIKFAYLKKPKNYYLQTEDEKSEDIIYYQFNTKDVKRTIELTLNNKKLRTNLQRSFIDELFKNFRVYELDYKEKYSEYLFEEIIEDDYSNCPF